MKLFNTATDTPIGDYPGDAPEALDAYARDRGWRSWRLWEIFSEAFGAELADAVARAAGLDSWAAWVAEGDAPREVPRPAPVGELALVDGAGEAVYL